MENRGSNTSTPGANPQVDLPSINDLVPLGHMLLPHTLANAFGLRGQREVGGEHTSTEASNQSFWWPTVPQNIAQPWFHASQGGNPQTCLPWHAHCLPEFAGGGRSIQKSAHPQNLGKPQEFCDPGQLESILHTGETELEIDYVLGLQFFKHSCPHPGPFMHS